MFSNANSLSMVVMDPGGKFRGRVQERPFEMEGCLTPSAAQLPPPIECPIQDVREPTSPDAFAERISEFRRYFAGQPLKSLPATLRPIAVSAQRGKV